VTGRLDSVAGFTDNRRAGIVLAAPGSRSAFIRHAIAKASFGLPERMKMKTIAWATDVHLTMLERPDVDRFCREVGASGAECLLLGGDISEAKDLVRWLEYLDERLEPPIYFVLGNHDYYGSDIDTVHRRVRALSPSGLQWLPDAGCVRLSAKVGLVGHGGWGDMRLGDVERFTILTDYLAIADLSAAVDRDDLLSGFTKRGPLRQKLASLGDAAAASLRPALLEAVQAYPRVLVLMHVPPFREACWHLGTISEEDWLPGFTCKAIGDLLLETAQAHPDCHLTVLCGHTHGRGYVRVRPNLDVHTEEADYGEIHFRSIELHGAGMEIKADA
jgi:hypothetical protein